MRTPLKIPPPVLRSAVRLVVKGRRQEYLITGVCSFVNAFGIWLEEFELIDGDRWEVNFDGAIAMIPWSSVMLCFASLPEEDPSSPHVFMPYTLGEERKQ